MERQRPVAIGTNPPPASCWGPTQAREGGTAWPRRQGPGWGPPPGGAPGTPPNAGWNAPPGQAGLPTKYCHACRSVIDARAQQCPRCGVQQLSASGGLGKSRPLTIALALLLGNFLAIGLVVALIFLGGGIGVVLSALEG